MFGTYDRLADKDEAAAAAMALFAGVLR